MQENRTLPVFFGQNGKRGYAWETTETQMITAFWVRRAMPTATTGTTMTRVAMPKKLQLWVRAEW
jgi:hypothetical protein